MIRERKKGIGMAQRASSDRTQVQQAKPVRPATAGAIGSVLGSTAPLWSTVHAAGTDETIRVALIGCGGRGTGAAAQALNTAGPVTLWAMADAFEDRLESSLRGLQKGLPKRYDRERSDSLEGRIDVPPERRFVGLDAYRKAIDSGVDVAIIAAPPGFRPLHFEYAVRAGKHVFMEKPLATDAAGVRRVLAAAKAAKKKQLKVGVGLQRHHDTAYQEAIRRIRDGALGDILALRCYWNGGPPAKTPYPRRSLSELEYQVRNWYFFTWLSGDHICEQHIHNLDVCNWIMRAHPVEAQGMGGRQVRTGKEYGMIYDHHDVEFTYADGTKMFSQCRQIRGCTRRVSEHAHGTRGTADLGSRATIRDASGKELWRVRRKRSKRRVNPYQAEHDVLFDAIRRGTDHDEAQSAAWSTMTAILGRLATYSGKVVRWDDAVASDVVLTTDAEDWAAEAPIEPDSDGSYPVAVPGLTRVL